MELSAVDVEFAGCSVHLHFLGLADVEFAGCSAQLHCLGLADVEFAGCSVHLHCLGLADVDLLSYSSQVMFRLFVGFCNLFLSSFARL